MTRSVTVSLPRYAPQLMSCADGEEETREQINLAVKLLCMFVQRFSKAVSLIEHCTTLIGPNRGFEPASWQGIAIRDAAMSVYHFGKTRYAFANALKAGPTLRALIDTAKLRDAWKAFDCDFPDAVLLRHAVAHLAEQLSSSQKIAELQRPGEFLIWESQVGGHLSMASNRGRQVQINADQTSLSRLQSVLANICEALTSADHKWLHVCD